jgi:tetratricopeptide (TPR) repeat protein
MDKERQVQIYLEALAMANEEKYETALEILEKNIKKNNRDYIYYFYHGFFTQQQDYKKYSSVALLDYLKAYKVNPDTYDINDVIGGAYIAIEEYEQAIPYLEKAYKLFLPGNGVPPPYWDLAEAYRHVGRLEDAIEMNTKAIEESEYSWQYFQRGVILSQFGNVQALDDNYTIAKTIEPDNLLLDRDYALRLVEMGYTEKAFQLYTEWLKGNETYYDWCYADTGYIFMLSGDWDKSIEMLKKAESINNTSFLTMQYLSFYYFFKEEYNSAYDYESWSRLQKDPSGITYWRKSIDEFLEGYKKNWQFQKLIEKRNVKK